MHACEILFSTRPSPTGTLKTVAKKARECASLEDALRWALTVLEHSHPEDRAIIHRVQIKCADDVTVSQAA